MDIISKINNTALGYNQQLAVRATNRMPMETVFPDNNTYNRSELRFGETSYAVPFRLALSSSPDDVFTLPLDPIVSINGSNEIVKRAIAKAVVKGDEIRGTVKELWTQDDWHISVSGVMSTTGNDDDESVEFYVDKLLKFLTAKEALVVECDVLNNLMQYGSSSKRDGLSEPYFLYSISILTFCFMASMTI